MIDCCLEHQNTQKCIRQRSFPNLYREILVETSELPQPEYEFCVYPVRYESIEPSGCAAYHQVICVDYLRVSVCLLTCVFFFIHITYIVAMYQCD